MTSEQLYEFLQTRWREPTGLQLSINSPKLKEIIPELQDSDRILLTGSSGGYKTTLTFRVIVDLISYALKNPDKTDVLVLYNVIEIPITEMYIKFIQYLFYKKLNKIYSRDRILNRNHTNKDEELEKANDEINLNNQDKRKESYTKYLTKGSQSEICQQYKIKSKY